MRPSRLILAAAALSLAAIAVWFWPFAAVPQPVVEPGRPDDSTAPLRVDPGAATDAAADATAGGARSARGPVDPAARDAGCVIRGLVVDTLGQPIAGASLRAVSPLHAGRAATSGADGRFRIEGLPPGRFTLQAGGAGRASTTREVRLAPEQPEAVCVIRLADGRALRGRLVDEAGAGVAGASVLAVGDEGVGIDFRADTVSGGDGRFRVEGAVAGPIVLRVHTERFGMQDQAVAAGEDDVTVVLRPQPAGVLAVEVRGLPDGVDPREIGLPLHYMRETWHRPLPEAVAAARLDAEGRARLAGMPPGEYTISVRTDRVFVAPVRIKVKLGPDTVAPVVFAVPPAAALRGTLALEGAGPLGGAPLSFQAVSSGLQVAVRTDTGGRFAAEVPWPKGTRIRVRSADPERSLRGEGDASGVFEFDFVPDAVQALVAVPALSVEGVVRGVDGAPAVDVAVTIQRPGRPWTSWARARTGAGGRFALTGLQPATEPLLLRAARQGEAVEQALSLAHGGVSGIELRMQELASVAGVVRDAAGAPLSGADVSLTAFRDPTGDALVSTYETRLTDSRGAYRFDEVAPGRYQLRAEHRIRKGLAAPRTVQLGAGAEQTGVDFRLEPGLEIGGRVLDADGKPVAGVLVFGVSGTEADRTTSRCSSDASGVFALEGLRRGEYRLFFNLPEELAVRERDKSSWLIYRAPKSVQVAAGTQGLEAVAGSRSTGGVRARLLVDGAARVRVALKGGYVTKQREVEVGDGELRLEPVVAGAYTLRITCPGFRVWSGEVTVSGGQTADLGVVRLAAAGEIRGQVVDAAGQPLAGVSVGVDAVWIERMYERRFWDDGARLPAARAVRATTDAGGRFAFAGMQDDGAMLWARHDGFAAVLRRLAADAGPQRIVLHRAGAIRISGLQVRIAGRPAGTWYAGVRRVSAGADDALYLPATGLVHELDAAADTKTFELLPPGRYEVLVWRQVQRGEPKPPKATGPDAVRQAVEVEAGAPAVVEAGPR